MTAPKRRSSDRGLRWLIRENAYRDVWLLFVTGLVLWAVSLSYGNSQDAKYLSVRVADVTKGLANVTKGTTKALCTFRADVEQRAHATESFLADHPEGIPGVPVGTLRQGLDGQRRTVKALRGLDCRAAASLSRPKTR